MNQFLKKTLLLSLPVLGFVVITFWQADGNADPYYLRFTTPQQNSLILESSRAAQGIVHNVVDSLTGRNGMFNYAMTMANSPYGKVYYESVIQKLDPSTLDGLFILEVSPWSICSETNDEDSYREADLFLSNLHCVDCKPNIEYLMRFYSEPFINLWRGNLSPLYLHENGWLEVSIPMDSTIVEERTHDKIDQYKNNVLPVYFYSEIRYEYLRKTIELLEKHGNVFLVRMPVFPEMMDLENALMPDFDEKMKALCIGEKVSYSNFSGDGLKYQYTDGNHFWKESARSFSIILGADISKTQMPL